MLSIVYLTHNDIIGKTKGLLYRVVQQKKRKNHSSLAWMRNKPASFLSYLKLKYFDEEVGPFYGEITLMKYSCICKSAASIMIYSW